MVSLLTAPYRQFHFLPGIELVLASAFNTSSIGDSDSSSFHGSIDGNGCFNVTFFQDYLRKAVRNASMMDRERRREIEGDPMVYIVAVLLFYSCGIVVRNLRT